VIDEIGKLLCRAFPENIYALSKCFKSKKMMVIIFIICSSLVFDGKQVEYS
jgi:hypothetical protein